MDFISRITGLLSSLNRNAAERFIQTRFVLHPYNKPIVKWAVNDTPTYEIHLFEDLWYTKKEIIESRLKVLSGKGSRLYARSCTISRIDKKSTNEFLNKNHLLESTGAYYKYGLFHNNKLMAVATFSKSRIFYENIPFRSYEWERFAVENGVVIIGGLTKLLKAFKNDTNASHIMTYADLDWGEGNAFILAGFKKHETIPPNIFYIKKGEWKRYRKAPNDADKQNFYTIENSGSLKLILDSRK